MPVSMSAPVVGVSVYFEQAKWGAWDIKAAELPHWYLDLFQDAGGRIVLLPPATNADALDRLDGLVLVGGADVDARRYGAAPHVTADAPRESRDESETVLYRGARERGMPVLGICRGLQIMAVAHGGTLIQNLPDLGLATVHREVPGQFVEHEATFAPGSLIAQVMGTTATTVNSSHHQG
ncbi:MAG: gamma-glutamyl-gamma-aminobutyrate hydrolase family protein, partial [Actinobacteria bacterium]|nr:gamma-glutamyl-gamma-aminobutyrate hydrolase family protein [Actinomycetota bacterium]